MLLVYPVNVVDVATFSLFTVFYGKLIFSLIRRWSPSLEHSPFPSYGSYAYQKAVMSAVKRESSLVQRKWLMEKEKRWKRDMKRNPGSLQIEEGLFISVVTFPLDNFPQYPEYEPGNIPKFSKSSYYIFIKRRKFSLKICMGILLIQTSIPSEFLPSDKVFQLCYATSRNQYQQGFILFWLIYSGESFQGTTDIFTEKYNKIHQCRRLYVHPSGF